MLKFFFRCICTPITEISTESLPILIGTLMQLFIITRHQSKNFSPEWRGSLMCFKFGVEGNLTYALERNSYNVNAIHLSLIHICLKLSSFLSNLSLIWFKLSFISRLFSSVSSLFLSNFSFISLIKFSLKISFSFFEFSLILSIFH